MDTPPAPPSVPPPIPLPLPPPPTTTTTTTIATDTTTASAHPIGVVPMDEATALPQNIVSSYCTSGVAANLDIQTTKYFDRSPFSSSSSSVQYLHTGSSSKKKSFQRPIPTTVAKTKTKKNDITPVPAGNEMVLTSSPPPPPPCTECGKIFRTMKSLFGHMRSHPERSWRGIKPPANCQRPLAPTPVLHFTETEHEVASALILLRKASPRFGAQGRRTRTSRKKENNRKTSTSTGIQVPALTIDLNQPAGNSNDGNNPDDPDDPDTSLDLKLSL